MSDAIGLGIENKAEETVEDVPEDAATLALSREWNDLVETFVADPGDFDGAFVGK